MDRTALYPGTFDPLTNGHIDLLEGAFRLCDKLVIAIGVHPSKEPMLSVDDRLELIDRVATPMGAAAGVTVEVSTFDNLVVDFAREVGATLLIRGLRDGTDLDYEMQMAGMNGTMAPGLQTVFLPATPGGPPHHRHACPADRPDGRRHSAFRAARRGRAHQAASRPITLKSSPKTIRGISDAPWQVRGRARGGLHDSLRRRRWPRVTIRKIRSSFS